MDFERTRTLLSRMAGKTLSDGQVISRVLVEFLENHDPERKTPRKRRVGDTSGAGARSTSSKSEPSEDTPPDSVRSDGAPSNGTSAGKHDVDSRYIAAEVKRAIHARSRGACEIPGCKHRTFLEYAHIVPHRGGGCREACNLARLCHAHHTEFDAGILTLVRGDANDPVWAKNGVIVDRHGRPQARQAADRSTSGTSSGHADSGHEDSGHEDSGHGDSGSTYRSPGGSGEVREARIAMVPSPTRQTHDMPAAFGAGSTGTGKICSGSVRDDRTGPDSRAPPGRPANRQTTAANSNPATWSRR